MLLKYVYKAFIMHTYVSFYAFCCILDYLYSSELKYVWEKGNVYDTT